MPAYIIITGGVMSGLGKGILSASIGRILKSCGMDISIVKIDPYLNVDAGTMSPFEHGEVYVLDDGGEVDLDFGHYERFLERSLTKDHNLTTGKVFKSIIEKEREGGYLGDTVQIVPHFTDHVKGSLKSLGNGADVVIVEIGGTVGDIEGLTFLEALRQMRQEEKLINIHLTHLPLSGIDQKTKPTQHSVIRLREAGIVPDLIVGRCEEILREGTREKIALFCDVEKEAVITDPSLDSIYELPLHLAEQDIHRIIQRKLGFKEKEPDLDRWQDFVNKIDSGKKVRVGIVGKYSEGDTYFSIVESLTHAGASLGVEPEIEWIDAEEFSVDQLNVDAMITPGGFGKRGTEGKIRAIKWARENKIPWLGLCLGFQLAVVELARDLGLDANSTEFDSDTPEPVIIPHWEARQDVLGGTMRLGAIDVELDEDSMTASLYGKTLISERHRHRYGLNPKYRERLEKTGLRFIGRAPCDDTLEVFELPDQFFVGVQFHPEYRSRPLKPHPLFVGLLDAAT